MAWFQLDDPKVKILESAVDSLGNMVATVQNEDLLTCIILDGLGSMARKPPKKKRSTDQSGLFLQMPSGRGQEHPHRLQV